MKTLYRTLTLSIALALVFHTIPPVKAQSAEDAAPIIVPSNSDDASQDGPSGINSNPSSNVQQDGKAGITSDPGSDEDQDRVAGIISNPSSDQDQDDKAPDSKTPEKSSSQSSSGTSGGASGSVLLSSSIAPIGTVGGQVLGAASSCGIYLPSPLSYRGKNDPKDVVKLQAFLNETLGSTIALDGVFSQSTLAAVKKFQLAHKDIIIDPWIENGKNPNGIATGYVGSTTLWAINDMVCPSLQLPKPVI